MESTVLSFLRCPATGEGLVKHSEDQFGTSDGRHLYRFEDGVYDFLTGSTGAAAGAPSLSAEKAAVQRYYDERGWQRTSQGGYHDTAAFVDRRDVSYTLTEAAIRSVQRQLPGGGRYLLDAGCGALPHDALLEYGAAFDRRVCIDVSRLALQEARRKLGPRGVYILADLTRLPVRDGTMCSAVSAHAVYHVPAPEQRQAFLELWRVVTPGGRALVVYAWPESPLEEVFMKIMKKTQVVEALDGGQSPDDPTLYYHAHSWRWFTEQSWPFRYRILPYRILSNWTMRRYMPNGAAGRLLGYALLAAQCLLPALTGRYGRFPIIVMHAAG